MAAGRARGHAGELRGARVQRTGAGASAVVVVDDIADAEARIHGPKHTPGACAGRRKKDERKKWRRGVHADTLASCAAHACNAPAPKPSTPRGRCRPPRGRDKPPRGSGASATSHSSGSAGAGCGARAAAAAAPVRGGGRMKRISGGWWAWRGRACAARARNARSALAERRKRGRVAGGAASARRSASASTVGGAQSLW